jgi:hypothetical protein
VQFFVVCDPRLAEFGLTRDVLMKDVEPIFRRNHIAPAERKEDYPKAGSIGPTYSIFIRASFAEAATVLRTGDHINADVWSNGWQYMYWTNAGSKGERRH